MTLGSKRRGPKFATLTVTALQRDEQLARYLGQPKHVRKAPLLKANSAAAPVIVKRAASLFEDPNSRVYMLVEMRLDDESRRPASDGLKSCESLRHDPQKYQRYFGLLKAAFEKRVINSPDTEDARRTIEVVVQETNETMAPVWSDGQNREGWYKLSDVDWPPIGDDFFRDLLEASKDEAWNNGLWFGEDRPMNVSYATARPNRVGAFEVYLVAMHSGEPKCYQLFSKLASRCWPSIDGVVRRCDKVLRRCFADWTLRDIIAAAQIEQDELRAKLEFWDKELSPELKKRCKGTLKTLAKADTKTQKAMEDPETLRVLFEADAKNAMLLSASVRSTAEAANEANEAARKQANEDILGAVFAPPDELEAAVLREKIERWEKDALRTVVERGREKLAELEQMDEQVQNAMADAEQIRAQKLDDHDLVPMSASVRAAALAKRAENDAKTSAADMGLVTQLKLPPDQREQSSLREAINLNEAEATPEMTDKARARLAEIEAMDNKVQAAMPDPDELHIVPLDDDSQLISASVRTAAKELRTAYHAAESELERLLNAPAEEVDQGLLRTKIASLHTQARRELVGRCNARLLELNANDETVERALSNPDTLQALALDESVRMSASVRAAARAKRAEIDAADAVLSAAIKLQIEDADLVAAQKAHSVCGTTPVRLAGEQKLAELRTANRDLRAAMAATPLEAPDLGSALLQGGHKTSKSVMTEAQELLAALEAADSALRVAMSVMPPVASELLQALAEHGQRASRSVAATALVHAEDAALEAAVVVVPLEAKELREALTQHGQHASPPVRSRIEQKLAQLEGADTALRVALTKTPREVQEIEASYAGHEAQASVSVRSETELSLETHRTADAAMTEAAAKTETEAAELLEVIKTHATNASASVVERVGARLTELQSADAALTTAISRVPIEASELEASRLEHCLHASVSVRAQTDAKLSTLRTADAALTAAVATVPREALQLVEAFKQNSMYASASVVAEVERVLSATHAADSALTSGLAAAHLEHAELADLLGQHGPHASHSSIVRVQEKLKVLEAADAAIAAAMAKVPLEISDLREALLQQGVYASESERMRLEKRIELPEASGNALKAMLVRTDLDANDLVIALDENPQASASVKEMAEDRLKTLQDADTLLKAAAATPSLEAAALHESLTRYGPYASHSVQRQVKAQYDAMASADTALRSAMAKQLLDYSALTELTVEHDMQASPSVRKQARERLATIGRGDALLKAALANPRLEAAELQAELIRSGPFASVSLADDLAAKVRDMKESDAQILAALKKKNLELGVLKAVQGEHATSASVTVRSELRQRINEMERADEALAAAMAKPSTTKEDLTVVLAKHGPHASAALKTQAQWAVAHIKGKLSESQRYSR